MAWKESIKSTDIDKEKIVEKIVNQMQPTITKSVVAEYTNDLRRELLVLLKKTDCYNRKVGKRAISSIEVTVLTEEEKREVRSYVISIFNLSSVNSSKPVN